MCVDKAYFAKQSMPYALAQKKNGIINTTI